MNEGKDRFEEYTFASTSAGRRRSRLRLGLLATGAMALLATAYVAAQGQRQGASAPLTIRKQGSFAVGGKILGAPTYDRCTAITVTWTTRFR